ncbi:MAG: transporter [Gammaproteobacteria bacterium]|nr:transporter [Gammaproteobacteria bacterium]MDP6732243.1 transporter [Gammaproteobacteria bacterium]
MLIFITHGVDGQQQPPLNHALSIGAYYAKGDYGELLDTTIHFFPVTYSLDRGNWGFQLMVPQIRIEGLGNVLVNIGGLNRAVTATQVSTSSGIGDSVATLVYRFDPISASAPFVELRLDAKLPTADEEKGLGTGEADYSIQADLSQYFGTAMIFATLGYNFRGTSRLYEGLQDSAFAQLGFVYPLNQGWSFGTFYDYREAASSFTPETHDLVPFVSWQLNEKWTFTAMTAWGFTDASADITALGQLSYRW